MIRMTRILALLLLLPLAQVQAQTPADIQEGAKIWEGYFTLENDCKLCHGVHGEGGFAKSLAGHQLTADQFIKAVRTGPGLMPAFVADKNLNDQQLGQVAAYLASLPKYTGPAPMWQTQVPATATANQKLYVTSGCGQCHGAIFANPRRTAGGVGGDYEWFKKEVWEHTSAPGHVNAKHLRMGNFSQKQIPEATLKNLWQFFAVEQGLRAPVGASVSAGVPSAKGTTYTIILQNTARPGGVTAEYITVTLPFLHGRDPEEVTTVVEETTGGGFTGVHRDPITNSQAAEFEVPKLGPGEKKTFTLTLSGKGAAVGFPRGNVHWEKPKLNSFGAIDIVAVAIPE